MQNKKGITLMAVVLIVIVMGILLSFTVIGIDGLIERTKAGSFASELKQIEYLVGEYKKRNNNKLKFTEVELDTSTLSSEFIATLSQENIVDGKVVLYKVNLVAIDAVNSLRGQKEYGEDDIYLVSDTTGIVYYKKGYEYSGNVYYSVTGKLKEILADKTEKIT